MARVERDRVRAYDVWAVIAAILVGFGSLALTLGTGLGVSVGVLLLGAVPLAMGVGVLARLFTGWRPPDRSLNRSVPEEVID